VPPSPPSTRPATLIYLANPTTGARGICHHIVTALGAVPRFQNAALFPQAADALAAEHAERGRTPALLVDFSDRPRWCPPRPASLLLAA
jgi:type II secretory pathway predicted ATPase ExeA